MTFHTRSTMVCSERSYDPDCPGIAFFIEIGPLVAALLLAGRVGSGIGAVLANMRATEQIDGIESLSIDSFKFLVVPRVVACVLALPLLTLFMDFSGLLGGFVSNTPRREFRSTSLSCAHSQIWPGPTSFRPPSRLRFSASSSEQFLRSSATPPIRSQGRWGSRNE